MNKESFVIIISALIFHFPGTVFTANAASTPTAFKICANTSKGTLTARAKCKSGETTLVPTSFTGPRGESAFDAIPSGKTVYGVIGNDLDDATGGKDFYGFASLPAPTSQVLTSEDVIVASTEAVDNDCVGSADCRVAAEVSVSSVCTGTALTPTAPAGKVCIYVARLSSSRIAAGSIAAYIVQPGSGTPTITPGFMVGWNSSAAGDTYLRAVWAYTAP